MRSWAEISIPALDKKFQLPQLSIFDTASSAKVAFEKKPLYRMYVCGITPYDATHLGHAATYLTFDLINRYLRATGAEVRFVQNITDIDDPLLERAARDGVDWKELAQSQIDLFRGDMVDLHILPPDHYVGVVEAIPDVVNSISALVESGTTYYVENDLYFKVRSDTEFGERSHYSQEEMLKIFSERGGDPTRIGKVDPLDALLWLAHREGEPSWESPFGPGRPGWHIECCAIALKYLSTTSTDEFSIDIQGGGSDLIFPHHEMSAAQSRLINGRKFSKTYVHAGMIGLDGEKMSKSLGNLVFVSKLIAQGVEPMAIRWALLSNSYSKDRMWSDEILSAAKEDIERLRLALSKSEVAPTDQVITEIISALSDDLDTPSALHILRNWCERTISGETGGSAGELSRSIDALLGIAL